MAKTKVKYKKLGREGAYAQCDPKNPKSIEVDEREKKRAKMKWKLHETLHIMFKKHDIVFSSEEREEKVIRSISNFQSQVLWDDKYRRIED